MDYVEGMLYMNDDEGEPIGETCPTCNGNDTHFEAALRFWKCETCLTMWPVGRNKSYFAQYEYYGTSDDTQVEK